MDLAKKQKNNKILLNGKKTTNENNSFGERN